MRAFAVDERDSAWERDDARFRVYTFEGPGNAVVTLDLVDATIEQALEFARGASNDNELLWSLAMVEDDSRGLRGLIWLSGMDYNDLPSRRGEWQRRRQMQDRYLLARSRRGLHPVLPSGQRLIRVFPEWGSGLPLWESFTEAYRRTGADLGLTTALSDALFEWNEIWMARPENDPVPAGWRDRGEQLVPQLRAELDGAAEVRPEFLSRGPVSE